MATSRPAPPPASPRSPAGSRPSAWRRVAWRAAVAAAAGVLVGSDLAAGGVTGWSTISQCESTAQWSPDWTATGDYRAFTDGPPGGGDAGRAPDARTTSAAAGSGCAGATPTFAER